MKNHLLPWLLVCASLAAATSGCGRKADANTELQRAAEALAEAPPAPAPAPAPARPTAAAQAAPAPEPAAPAAVPGVQMNEALAAYKAGNLEDAVTRLQKLRATSAMTPQQRMALNDAMAAVMTEIYALAAKGDSRAAAAVKQYEHMQTQQR